MCARHDVVNLAGQGQNSPVGNHGGSAMSDYNRSATTSPFGQATGRASVAIDEGLRTYMLHVYNYMVLGLAITGLAALGIYMASVTGDAS
jgi:FtsH-binding integral membrane protein